MSEELEMSLFARAGISRLAVYAALRDKRGPEKGIVTLVKRGKTLIQATAHPDFVNMPDERTTDIFAASNDLVAMSGDDLVKLAKEYVDLKEDREPYGAKHELSLVRVELEAEKKTAGSLRTALRESQLGALAKDREIASLRSGGKSNLSPEKIYRSLAEMLYEIIEVDDSKGSIQEKFEAGKIEVLLGHKFTSRCVFLHRTEVRPGYFDIIVQTTLGQFLTSGMLEACEIEFSLEDVAANQIRSSISRTIAECFKTGMQPLLPSEQRELDIQLGYVERQRLSRYRKEEGKIKRRADLGFTRYLDWKQLGRPISFADPDTAIEVDRSNTYPHNLPSMVEIVISQKTEGGWDVPLICVTPIGIADGDHLYRLQVFPGVAKGPFTPRSI